jgi:ribosomal protein L37AE/L43A
MKLCNRLFHEARFVEAEFFCPNCRVNDWDKKEDRQYTCKKCKTNINISTEVPVFENAEE